MSATLGVAAATLLVVGGILAGPSLLECSGNSGALVACLRDKLHDTGIVSPEPETAADTPSESGAAPVPAGWMEAKANEYEAATSASADLISAPASITAVEASPPAEIPVEVAVVPPAELAAAVPRPTEDALAVALDGDAASLLARGTASATPPPPAAVALVGPQGEVTALSLAPEVSVDGTTGLTQPPGRAEGFVEAPPEQDAGPVELQASASAEPIAAPATVKPPPPVVVEFDPQYPNVLVLPPPAEGDNSSFRALQLD